MSKRFQEALKLVDLDKTYSPEEAIKLAKETSTVKFDASVELHYRLGVDPKQTDQKVRTQVSLPHGIGKTIRVCAFVSPGKEKEATDAGADLVGGEDLIKQIKQTERTDFDLAVAEPGIMKNLAMIAKILGQRGLMPNPKAGTVGDNVSQMVKDLKSGSKLDLKMDDAGNLHTNLGKASFDETKLLENFKAIDDAVRSARPPSVKKEFIKSTTISTSMGPGIRVK